MASSQTAFWHTDETRRQLSDIRRGSKNPFFGRKHSPETIEKMRQRMRDNSLRPDQYTISPRSLRPFSETEAAYLAAIVDGEGSITRHKGRPAVYVYNTDLSLMQWLKDRIGRDWRRHGQSTAQPARRPCWAWSAASANDVYYVLTRIQPYLVIKHQKAREVISELEEKYGARLG